MARRTFTSGGNLVWSVTGYRPVGSATCISTHWTGSHPSTSPNINGQVSNENGPFGTFTINLGVACRAGADAPEGADPTAQ